MDLLDHKLKQRARQEPFSPPHSFTRQVLYTCDHLVELSKQTGRTPHRRPTHWATWAAAAAATLFLALPNLSVSAAALMEQIPILGGVVQVITLRNYWYDDGNSTANISIPQAVGGGSAEDAVNQAIQRDSDRLLAQFYEDAKILSSGGYQLLDISYDVVTDTDTWFTLRLSSLQIEASGHEMVRYYHIDRQRDAVITLSTLFPSDMDYVSVLSQEVRRQMEDRNIHNLGNDPVTIDPNQNFYWSPEGQLVLVFDEGTLSAASEGMLTFPIPKSVTDPLLCEAAS